MKNTFQKILTSSIIAVSLSGCSYDMDKLLYRMGINTKINWTYNGINYGTAEDGVKREDYEAKKEKEKQALAKMTAEEKKEYYKQKEQERKELEKK